MERYFIEEVKRGYSPYDMEKPQKERDVIVSIRFRNQYGEKQWYVLEEAYGTPGAYLADWDLFDTLLDDDKITQEVLDYLGEHGENVLGDIYLDDYRSVFKDIYDHIEDPEAYFFRYLIAVAHCDEEDLPDLIARGVGRYADEIDIPPSRDELAYLADPIIEEDEDGDSGEDFMIGFYENDDDFESDDDLEDDDDPEIDDDYDEEDIDFEDISFTTADFDDENEYSDDVSKRDDYKEMIDMLTMLGLLENGLNSANPIQEGMAFLLHRIKS